MPKSINYKITLYPAQKDGGFIVTKFVMMGKYPEHQITAAGMADLIEQVTQIALAHGEGRSASVRCLAHRKPPGFKAATKNLYFNLDEQLDGTASAA